MHELFAIFNILIWFRCDGKFGKFKRSEHSHGRAMFVDSAEGGSGYAPLSCVPSNWRWTVGWSPPLPPHVTSRLSRVGQRAQGGQWPNPRVLPSRDTPGGSTSSGSKGRKTTIHMKRKKKINWRQSMRKCLILSGRHGIGRRSYKIWRRNPTPKMWSNQVMNPTPTTREDLHDHPTREAPQEQKEKLIIAVGAYQRHHQENNDDARRRQLGW